MSPVHEATNHFAHGVINFVLLSFQKLVWPQSHRLTLLISWKGAWWVRVIVTRPSFYGGCSCYLSLSGKKYRVVILPFTELVFLCCVRSGMHQKLNCLWIVSILYDLLFCYKFSSRGSRGRVTLLPEKLPFFDDFFFILKLAIGKMLPLKIKYCDHWPY